MRHSLIVVLVAACMCVPAVTSATSVTWSSLIASSLGLANAFNVPNSAASLSSPTVVVQYRAFVRNAETGEIIPPNGQVQVGTPLELVFDEHRYDDLYWFVTGGHMDTPYGDWGNPDIAPPVRCEEKDFAFNKTRRKGNGSRTIFGPMYAPMIVQPPVKTTSGTSNLACGTASADGSRNCTASAAGNVPLSFTFGETFGKFYIRVRPTTSSTLRVGVCHGKGEAMDLNNPTNSSASTGSTSNPAPGSLLAQFIDAIARESSGGNTTKTMMVPQQIIDYPITVVDDSIDDDDANRAPSSASLTHSGQCHLGIPQSIRMHAIDLDGDNIRYGVDWDGNGTVDQYVPASGYVSSGTEMTASRTYAVAGTKTVTVYVQDEQGLSSAGRSLSFNCTEQPDPSENDNTGDNTGASGFNGGGGNGEGVGNGSGSVTQGNISAVPSVVRHGGSSRITWSAQNVQSCVVVGGNGDSWSGISGTRLSSSIVERTVFTLTCQTRGGTLSDSAAVNIIPSFEEI